MRQMYLAIRSCVARALQIVFPEPADAALVRNLDAQSFFGRALRRHNDLVLKHPKAFSPFSYADPFVRAAIHCAKYRGNARLCRSFGAVLWDLYGESISVRAILHAETWTVIPIPSSAKRLRERGYNQAAEIARGFLERADPAVFSLRERALSRYARNSQARTRSRQERLRNALDSFYAPDPDAIFGQNVLLVDDVITTGATLKDAARALSGARRILCITVAH